jgi:hypothetical protein
MHGSKKGPGIALLVGATALLALPACSSLPAERDVPSTYRETLDTEVMAVVETTATRSGTEVYWINPPRKAKKD